jgi:hypothetical protein
MNARTVSEELFEKLCSMRGVGCAPILTTGEKTADYRLSLGSLTLITEVKQLDPVVEDRHLAEGWGTPDAPGAEAPSDRVQGLLAKGYPQVKRSSEDKWATMIVLYNNSGPWNWIDSFTVAKAMFGSYGIVLELRSNQSIAIAGQGYLGQRKLTKNTFRSLSVVGVLSQPQADAPALDCYHNPFANE